MVHLGPWAWIFLFVVFHVPGKIILVILPAKLGLNNRESSDWHFPQVTSPWLNRHAEFTSEALDDPER